MDEASRELAALREENARLYQYRAEDIEREGHLRAHVAALVQVIQDTLRTWPHLAVGRAAHIALQQALTAPDLAALAAAAQAREAEHAAFGERIAKLDMLITRAMAEGWSPRELREARAALDATQGR